jgi:hypothetical protein
MRRAFLTLIALLCPVTLHAQMTPIAVINCTSTNFPDCGHGYWGTKLTTTPGVYEHHTVERVGNGIRFRLTPGSASGLTQFYMGWQPTLNSSVTDLYIRFRLTVNGPIRANGVGDVYSSKFIIVNNGGSLRAIGELKPQTTSDLSDLTHGIQVGINGPPSLTPRINLVPGTVYYVQIRVSRGGSVRFAQWLNNNNQSAPTSQSTGTFSFNPATFQNVGIGFYNNASLANNGNIDLTLTDVQFDDQFDPNWFSTGPQPPPPPAPLSPTLVRVS